MPADNPTIYRKFGNYYESTGNIWCCSGQVVILRLTLEMNELAANGRNTFFFFMCAVQWFILKKIFSILLRWQIFMSDMCQYLAANFRTTTIPAVSGSTTLPHSAAFLWLLGPRYFYMRGIKDEVSRWSKYSLWKSLEFRHTAYQKINKPLLQNFFYFFLTFVQNIFLSTLCYTHRRI